MAAQDASGAVVECLRNMVDTLNNSGPPPSIGNSDSVSNLENTRSLAYKELHGAKMDSNTNFLNLCNNVETSAIRDSMSGSQQDSPDRKTLQRHSPAAVTNCEKFNATSFNSIETKECAQKGDKNCENEESMEVDQHDSEEDDMLSDVESFDGKIVYNPDGSAYIIEGADSDMSDGESLLDVPQVEGSIIEQKGRVIPTSQIPVYPQIANAFYVSKNPAFYNHFYMLSEQKSYPEAPIMHSYRVYDLRSGKKNTEDKSDHDVKPDSSDLNDSGVRDLTGKSPNRNFHMDTQTVPTKPILMCFLCKLSFGYAKSFVAHAISEHNMVLNDEEKGIMSGKNCSAIIQALGKEKEPLLSFLEPNLPNCTKSSHSPKTGTSKAAFPPTSITTSNTNVSFVHTTKPTPVEHQSKAATSSQVSSNDVSSIVTLSQSVNHNREESDSERDELPSGNVTPNSELDDSNPDSEMIKNNNNLPDLTSSNDLAYPYGTGNSMISRGSPKDFSLSSMNSSNVTLPLHFGGQIPSPLQAHLASMMPQGTCEDHPQGKAQGVECPKCDMILGSSRSLGGHMTMMHSRNSCKTLKCPKCNWHYKYQETLEIHMKEKHPDSDTQCIYCITHQPHPRLARGEAYTCGYKPYRCDVCNYSTTTKGNLSIHMQSDKHINNIQELQNGGSEIKLPPQPQPHPQPPPLTPDPNAAAKKQLKPKPTWRCDVCNYETNVARNLRIHMTSEKHTHNMMVLQQNVKHMQRDMQMQMALFGGQETGMMGMPSPMTPTGMPPFPYDQSMFMSQVPGALDSNSPVDLTKAMDHAQAPTNGSEDEPTKIFQCSVCNVFSTDSLESLHQHMQIDRTKSKPDDNVMVSSGNYMCQLCSYKTNLKANFQLHCKTDKHLQRLQLINHIKEGGTSNEWRLKYMNMSNPIQVKCNSCDYYTNSIHKLQMHSANPRHEPSSQIFRHLQNGESSVRSERKYYHCSLCNYATKAKLNLIQHVRTMKHMRNDSLRQIQQHEAGKSPETDRMCFFSVKEFNESDNIEFDEGDGEHLDEESNGPNSLENSMTEVPLPGSTSAAHLNNSSPDNSDGMEAGNAENIHICPYCNYSSVNEMRIQAHITTQHSQPASAEMNCPLCQDGFKEKAKLERHLAQSHNVSHEGVQRLMVLVDHTRWSPPTAAQASASDLRMGLNESQDQASTPEDDSMETKSDASELDAIKIPQDDAGSSDDLNGDKEDEEFRCHTCSSLFRNIDALYAHQNELGHLELKQTPRGPGYLCWKKGCNQYFKTASALQVHFREIHTRRQHLSVSERHVYKYRCNQCSLAFKTLEKLQTHSQYHMIRAATRCTVCDRSFRTLEAMRKHVESTHLETMTEEEVSNYKASLLSNPLALLGSTIENVINQENHDDEMREDAKDMSMSSEFKMAEYEAERQSPMSDDQTNDSINNDGENDDGSESSYRENYFFEDYINSQAIAEDSYNDPARKFKCHRCKVAFTKQNYLTAHNKTLLHRKGDKMNYPMEKYMDPNRPYKCDVCKESFTQKNILLVHYNSVSHLHKLKQAALSTSLSPSPTAAISPISTPASTSPVSTPTLQPPSTSPSATATSASNANSDQKPFKCNICKVAYSQGSTLDIHMRSVLHQTRTSKLQELAITGQVDLTQPLVEQPEKTPQAQSAQNQHKKLLAEMLQQKHLPLNLSMSSPITNPPGIFATNISPVTSHPPPSTTPTSQVVSPATTPTATSSQSNNQPMFTCQRCSSIFVSAESLGQHQQMYCYFQPPQTLMIPGLSAQSQLNAMRRSGYIPRFKPQVHKNLLENFGFECVMQFNENNQVVKVKKEGEKTDDMIEKEKELKVKVKKEKYDMPEIGKGVCDRCGKTFSSIWVLKAHQEEIHKDVVPIDFIEQFGENFKEDFEKRQPPVLMIGTEGLPAPLTPSLATPPMPSAPSTPNSDINVKIEPSSGPPSCLSLDLPPVTPVTMMNMMQMSMPLGMPISMGMQPPLIPMMLPTMENPFTSGGMLPAFMDPNMSQKIQQQQQQAAAAANNQKRARTRINDEQLKILRGHFDINNSPSEEQIIDMSDKSGLPQKVIKHWFRNTLFKERQRNKDSPYNFNNPPSTTLNLEEYEKTGKISTSTSDTNSEPDTSKPINMIHDDLPLPPPRPEPMDIKPDLKHLERKLVIKQEPEDHHSKLEEQIREGLKEKIHQPALISPGLAFPVATAADFLNVTPPAPISSMLMTTPPPILPPMQSTSAPRNRSDSLDSCSYDLTPAQIAANAASNRRANRTRFTDYQIKTLQDYFEQNAYPKDDDLEHLSKVLNLSPRVIVVWFQNARQKARKVYENQPPVESPSEDSSGRFQRTPGLNYQCKKCLTVFQRYYELIKHQKKHCFKDEDIAPSQVFGGDDSNSSSVNLSVSDTSASKDVASENSNPPICTTVEKLRLPPSESPSTLANFKCDKCTLTFPRFDLWQEHQNIHIMNPSLFQSFAPDSAFGVLQNLAQQQAAAEQEKSPSKRKLSEIDDDDDHDDLQPRDKRLRTTILPEQLDYLYQKYQVDCNPSRKQLENIATEVGLKKRVVQVWFQNTRARERKGQYRAHQQLIHKRCPFCRALFRAKSALESHLATKHPEEMAKGEINIDSIPDAPGESPSPLTPTSTSPGLDMAKLMANPFNMQPFMPFMPTPNLGLPPTSEPIHMQMKRMYEDSLKKYMDDFGQTPNEVATSAPKTPPMHKPSTMSKGHQDDDAPLDLSNPVKVPVMRDNRHYSYDGPITDGSSNRSFDHFNNSRVSFDDSISETHSESTENDYEDSNPASPNGSHRSPSSHVQKRYRTQMTNLQVKVMKTLFVDYKTPTMAECEMLGREIGLAKRVIQVWFQNARAKEKKAKSSSYGSQYTNEVELPPMPDECRYCNFNYSHKYSIQDHIFTKKHIDNVRKSLQSQLENEREMSEPGSLNRQQESERLQEVNMATHPHLAQLQAMGLQAMGLPANLGVIPGMPASAMPTGSSAFTEALSKEAQKSRSRSKVKVKDEPKEDIVKKKESTSVSEAAITPQMLSPFGPLFPGSEAGLLPFMYPGGMPGFYPGMGLQPFMQPGLIPDDYRWQLLMQPPMFPGAESVFSYDPSTFGTPLTLLQIPQEAIRNVTAKLNDPNCTVAQYTQDCKTLHDLKSMVSAANLALVTETNVDVGFICKKCHMVYPAKEACQNHQRMMCFAGKNTNDQKQVLKLEQVQYQCGLCMEGFSILQEYKHHCDAEAHKTKMATIGLPTHAKSDVKTRKSSVARS